MADKEARWATSRERVVRGETWSRGRRSMAAAAMLVTGLMVAAGPAASASASTGTAPTRLSVNVPAAGVGPLAAYLVRTAPGRADQVAASMRAAGVQVTGESAGVDVVVVRASSAQVSALAAMPGVADVTPDGTVALMSNDYDPKGDINSMQSIDDLLNADDAWAAGATGQGIDVAVIDSGVTPVAGLDSGQVVNGPDLSFESQSDNTRYLDTYGHGTFMAGLIAGHDPGVVGDPTADDSYQGVAPGSRVVSIKVADSNGRTDVSQVIAAIDWVVQHADDPGFNIRVLSLSFGTDSLQRYTVDPLAYAAEVAWRSGIVVVVSSGNTPGNRLTDPAIDPFVIATGALDTNGTATTRDDRVASFTTVGSWNRHVDVLSPGVHVQGLRVPGSYIDMRFGGTGRLGDRFFRGSGTSEAAALTSGVVALMLSQRPYLTPDQVKRVLTTTGYQPAKGNSFDAVVPNAYRATFSGRPGPAQSQDFRYSTGTGSLELSRGSTHVTQDGSTLVGEQDIFGNPVNTRSLARAEANGASWDGGTWNGATWAGASWDGSSWASAVWTGASWDGASWDGASWDGASWDGASWDGASWDGVTWDGASWDGASWDGASWDGATWDGQGWDGCGWDTYGWEGQGWR
jgi:serine protease AprX